MYVIRCAIFFRFRVLQFRLVLVFKMRACPTVPRIGVETPPSWAEYINIQCVSTSRKEGSLFISTQVFGISVFPITIDLSCFYGLKDNKKYARTFILYFLLSTSFPFPSRYLICWGLGTNRVAINRSITALYCQHFFVNNHSFLLCTSVGPITSL